MAWTSARRMAGSMPTLGKFSGDPALAAAWEGPGAVSSLARSRAAGGNSAGEDAVLLPSVGGTAGGDTLVTGAGTGDGGSVGAVTDSATADSVGRVGVGATCAAETHTGQVHRTQVGLN